MPISRKDFDAGLDSTTLKFFRIFSENPDKAYTTEELTKIWNVDTWVAVMMLILFQQRGLIKYKVIGLESYYTVA